MEESEGYEAIAIWAGIGMTQDGLKIMVHEVFVYYSIERILKL
jgi:hypothetical protein